MVEREVEGFEIGDEVAKAEWCSGIIAVAAEDGILWGRGIIGLAELEPDFFHFRFIKIKQAR
jgi:hypothetical protein